MIKALISLFGLVSFVKHIDPDNYKYSGYDIELDAKATFLLKKGSGNGKNVIIFGVDMSSRVHLDNKEKNILISGDSPAQALDDTSEKEYSINFTEQQTKFGLSFHYNESNSYIFVNDFEIYKFKAKDFKINLAPLCFGNISKDFSVDNINQQDYITCAIFQLILIVLVLIIFWIFLNI